MNKLIPATWVLVLAATGLRAQQQQQFAYTQYMNDQIPFNQAYSMLDKSGSINAVIRKQYVGVNGSPGTFIFDASFPVESVRGAAGMLVMNDQFGIEHNTQISAFFAKAVQLGDTQYLSVSLSAGIKNYTANFSSLDSSDPEFRDDIRQTTPNLGFGIMLYGGNYYAGISMPQLTITNLGTAGIQNLTNFRNHYYLSGAFITNLSDEIKLKPAALMAYVRGTTAVVNLSGTLFLKDVLGLGFNYSTNKLAAGILSINISTFRLGYSYQFGTEPSNLAGFNSATHEISLSFRFGQGSEPRLL